MRTTVPTCGNYWAKKLARQVCQETLRRKNRNSAMFSRIVVVKDEFSPHLFPNTKTTPEGPEGPKEKSRRVNEESIPDPNLARKRVENWTLVDCRIFTQDFYLLSTKVCPR